MALNDSKGYSLVMVTQIQNMTVAQVEVAVFPRTSDGLDMAYEYRAKLQTYAPAGCFYEVWA